MAMSKFSLKAVEDVIIKANPEEQRKLLANLPHLLKVSYNDLFWAKAAEQAFDFWNNPDDVIYDHL